MNAAATTSSQTTEVLPRSSSPQQTKRSELDIGTLIGEILPEAIDRLRLTYLQLRVLFSIAMCRTKALGLGIAYQCEDSECGHRGYIYRACGNRHCPKCLWRAQLLWLAGRMKRLLPCSYYHVVFTLPSKLRPLFLSNQQVLYGLFFRTVAKTLHTLAADPKWLGAKIGFTLMLHTWARDLQYHPHLHGLVSAGGLSPGGRWLTTHGDFLFPKAVASSLFKKLFLMELERLYNKGELELGGSTAYLAEPKAFRAFKRKLWDRKWVVYIKRPFGGPEQVLKYLGQYTHRVGLSNSRLLEVDEESVRFRTRGEKSVRMSRLEFVRRFALHVLPWSFMKIRHYGLLSPGNVNGALKQAWEAALASSEESIRQEAARVCKVMEAIASSSTGESVGVVKAGEDMLFLRRCPKCGKQSYRATLSEEPEPVPAWLPEVARLSGRTTWLSSWKE